jgi:2-polyprenyl-3-methyl-5-hydroxy-6-metoxy-1,4-benzoquinol methylase
LSNKIILDAGCGTGHNMQSVQSKGYYVGCDIMPEALEFCRSNGADCLVQSDSQALGFRSSSFDMIISLDVLEHIANPMAVMSEFKRLLKDDGVLVLSVPAFRFLWSAHDESLSHFRRYNRSDFEDLVHDSGFQIKKTGYLRLYSYR